MADTFYPGSGADLAVFTPGKTVYYMACRTNPTNVRGPWSSVISATVAG